MSAPCVAGNQFDPSTIVSHKPELEDSLKPPALCRLSGRNGGQFSMTSKTTNIFSSEDRARAVRMVQEHGGEDGPDIEPSPPQTIDFGVCNWRPRQWAHAPMPYLGLPVSTSAPPCLTASSASSGGSRSVATPCDKHQSSFFGFVQLATIRCWIRFVTRIGPRAKVVPIAESGLKSSPNAV